MRGVFKCKRNHFYLWRFEDHHFFRQAKKPPAIATATSLTFNDINNSFLRVDQPLPLRLHLTNLPLHHAFLKLIEHSDHVDWKPFPAF